MKTYLEMKSSDLVNSGKHNSFSKIHHIKKRNRIVKLSQGLLVVVVLLLFLPWTQNVKFKGYVTSLNQEDRPQQLNNIIPGRIKQWYVKEGDMVNVGDTILEIGEVKEDYFDANLLDRTLQQISAKEKALQTYEGKANTASSQLRAMNELRDLKLKQLKNKIAQQRLYISIDSSNVNAGSAELKIYERQIDGAKKMFDSGAISLTEYEKRTANYQNGLAKFQSLENKLSQSRRELENLFIEKDNVIQDYNEKLSKTEGERLGSISNVAGAEYDIAKLRNTYANYDERRKLYYILSPAKGQVGNIKKTGIGMLIKEGDFIADILPNISKKAIEVFIDPIDLPLVNPGQRIQFTFDGYPAIMIDGWPSTNYGTFSGKIYIIEKASTKNGKFRALVIEDADARPWPKVLNIGGGAEGIALLKDVPIYYEIWRKINGFPQEFYTPDTPKTIAEKK
jgi:multidrug efflux pump subunit AcrA (membrane-fusion protein)